MPRGYDGTSASPDFENGAITGAFGYLFNSAVHSSAAPTWCGDPTCGPPPIFFMPLFEGDAEQALVGTITGIVRLYDWLTGKSGNYDWGNESTLEEHFESHGADFGAASPQQYARMARDFYNRADAEDLPTKIDESGTIRIYDPKTNTFGAYNPNGSARTFFKPTSPTYFSRQPGVPLVRSPNVY